ncbi:hypothetical protein XJ27_02460 [Xanthomonas hortorum]|nr:hypothetical protein XJ27_02460 [Xanthomonas hortorum]
MLSECRFDFYTVGFVIRMQSSGQHGYRDFGQPTGSPNCQHQFFFLLQALVRLASFLSSKLKRDAALRVGLTGEFLIEEVVVFKSNKSQKVRDVSRK